jgi:putative N-acetyltransferase (TIGR04045 family)
MTVLDAAGLSGLQVTTARLGPLDGAGLAGTRPPRLLVEVADARAVAAYRRLRRIVFVQEQGLFARHDLDDVDDDPRCVVLVARIDGTVVGGVRLAPATDPDLGWWQGSRLAVAAGARAGDVGGALVRAACAHAESAGALRFEAAVQHEAYFARLGWDTVGCALVAGRAHVLMRWPIGRVQALVETTKAPLGALLAGLAPGGAGWVGDDAAPVPGSDLLAACDAIVPSMVERDPEWAGWCSVLVNLNDLAAMGAAPVGLLDAVGARSASAAARVLHGVAAAARAWDVPVLGGHTTLGVPASLAVTALGRTAHPVPAGGGRPGHAVSVTADLSGQWRPGYRGRQWDSTSERSTEALRALQGAIAAAHPAAAKDVSMAGLVGTLGMLAEASSCSAVLEVAAVPRPAGTTVGDWLTCFPGFAMVTTDHPGRSVASRYARSATCGELAAGTGVSLRWPDGAVTSVVPGPVTGMGAA